MTAQDPRYNWVYKELVTNDGDVSGALAYMLYKQEKIAFIENFVAKKNRQPEEADMEPFHEMTKLPKRLAEYRASAEQLMEQILDNVLADKLNELTKNMRDDAIVKAVKKTWWQGVWENMVAGLFTTVITFFALLAMLVYNEGAGKIFTTAVAKFAGDTPSLSTSAEAGQVPPVQTKPK